MNGQNLRLVLYIVSDDSRYVTGTGPIDGRVLVGRVSSLRVCK
jgi:hypothetical protein